MPMSNAPEEFAELRRLLKLKRHELPPPGYFNNFSLRVIQGIEAAKREKVRERGGLWSEAPWLARLLQSLESNTLAAGSFAVALCVLMVGGIYYSEYADQNNSSGETVAVGSDSTSTSLRMVASGPGAEATQGSLAANPVALNLGTNGSIFNTPSTAPANPFDSLAVSYQPMKINYEPAR